MCMCSLSHDVKRWIMKKEKYQIIIIIKTNTNFKFVAWMFMWYLFLLNMTLTEKLNRWALSLIETNREINKSESQRSKKRINVVLLCVEIPKHSDVIRISFQKFMQEEMHQTAFSNKNTIEMSIMRSSTLNYSITQWFLPAKKFSENSSTNRRAKGERHEKTKLSHFSSISIH